MSANHDKVEALFNAALKFTPAERPAFLAGACGSDATLRRQLEELLKAEAEAGDFLPEAPQDPNNPPFDVNDPFWIEILGLRSFQVTRRNIVVQDE